MKQLYPLLFLLVFAAACRVSARPPITFRGVEFSEPRTPSFQDADGEDSIQADGFPFSPSSDRHWLRVTAEYETHPEWIDQMTLLFYVLLPTDEDPLLFTGRVDYINIPEGRDHISDMYLHFNTYRRYFQRGNIHYAVVALIDGNEVAVKTNRRRPEQWWKTMKPHSTGLLNRLDTPFRVLNVERYQAQPVSEQQAAESTAD